MNYRSYRRSVFDLFYGRSVDWRLILQLIFRCDRKTVTLDLPNSRSVG
ncbi:hypothetical protein [Chamaesiphon sp. VAR_48_metabat_403]|nr:hypothetical protein [Chamaesiphon sp. VAR_48_metabat_403]